MIQRKILLLVSFLLSIQLVSNLNAQSCYELVWNDEFNYSGLPDSTLWSFEEGGGGWGNNELQYYTSKRIENAYVENGYLTIEARKENYGGRNYTSARLITYPNGHSWKYGKIEARIKLPYGQGIWPAFWMLGNGIFEGTSWPGCGEIDIMEMIGGGEGKDDVIYGTMHYDDNGHAEYGDSYQLPDGIFADNFHVFTLEWTQTQLKWYMDGIKYHEASITPSYLTEFQKEFFILLNIAVGGNWPGSPDASTIFPQKMVIDYVRVYQQGVQPEITGPILVNKDQKDIVFKTLESDGFIYNWNVPDDAIIQTGQGTNEINVTWGCDTGNVTCEVIGNCSTYNLTLAVNTEKIEISGRELVESFSVNTKYKIPELNSTTYQWYAPDDATFTGDTDTNIVFVNWGNTSGYIKVDINNNCGIEQDSILVNVIKQLPYPDPNSRHIIPGIIEATDYDSGGEGISYHDVDIENNGTGPRQDEAVDTEYNDGGSSIGWIEPGEWVEYNVNVESTGLYDIELRFASLNGGGQMEIHFSDEDRTGVIPVQATGSWTSFYSAFLRNISLYDTDTLMRLRFNIGKFNISRLKFTKNVTSIPEISNEISDLEIYPNPANDFLQIKNIKETYNYTIINIMGEISQKGLLLPETTISINTLHKGTYILNLYNNYNTYTFRFIKL
ncbi:MAG: hypothetical protein A2W99_08380 [Bacteroidetes bacterium GWF2_33_16]|nr:MAG: hypothetical protein A2X00_00775 [Bacteroidetes bacterium GWE2_32_14]OFY05521.1 MAG: hypothetical protein A2W99_08380 [Bacteroidetes bacterium GWF2_33_16]